MYKNLLNIKNIVAGAMILSAGVMNAQQWEINGNSGITNANYVGTRESAYLFLRTDGSSSNPGQAFLTSPGSFVVDAVNYSNGVKAKGSIITGGQNMLGGNANSSIVGGWGNSLQTGGGANLVVGQTNTILNDAGKSIALGWNNIVRASNQFAIGVGVDLKSEYSGGFGVDLVATGNRSFVIGTGTHASTKLTNSIPYSIMFGLSKNSTMLIKDQLVGVRTTDPTANFHTVGTVRLQDLPNGSGNALVVDADGNVMVASTALSKQANDQTVTELQNQIDDLKLQVDELKNLLLKQTGIKDISLSNSAKLYQNVPNPVKGETNIRYYIPDGSKNSIIEIYSVSGQLVKSIPIKETGDGNIAVSNIKSGMYLYRLSVEGKIIDTKKMLIQD
ncbi:T9SS type A sorting domain-containing protein [Chryseobacterium phocaeense]|uniref:T9SS type A sorting domain-containing protein n=1 Tax=Chryseobacterium phocaeense TaxID=1816690 RepID=UPI0009B94DAD|nr:T9SS type A sorting domain-containing protein [Chryseobacterium phocaeense]